MELKNADTGEEINDVPLPPVVKKAVDVLNALEDGTFLTMVQVARRVRCHPSTLNNCTTTTPLRDMRVPAPYNTRYWLYVSEATKAAYVKEQGAV